MLENLLIKQHLKEGPIVIRKLLFQSVMVFLGQQKLLNIWFDEYCRANAILTQNTDVFRHLTGLEWVGDACFFRFSKTAETLFSEGATRCKGDREDKKNEGQCKSGQEDDFMGDFEEVVNFYIVKSQDEEYTYKDADPHEGIFDIFGDAQEHLCLSSRHLARSYFVSFVQIDIIDMIFEDQPCVLLIVCDQMPVQVRLIGDLKGII